MYSQWHFRRWVGDIWLMRNRWTSSDIHYTCSFLRCSLPCSLISLFSPVAELFLLLLFKWEGMFVCSRERPEPSGWPEPRAIPAIAVRKCLSCSMYLPLGSLHAVLHPSYHIPFPLPFLDPPWQQQRPLSHVPFLSYDLFNDLRSTFMKPILWDLAVYPTVKRYPPQISSP